MALSSRWQRVLRRGLLLASLLAASGCLGFIHPLQTPPDSVNIACRSLPQACRDHVYIYVINGIDPADISNLSGMCQYIRDLGFVHTESGQFWQTGTFMNKIRSASRQDPEARTVLIGYSFGVSMVRCLAHQAEKEGIPIELAIYLDACSCNHLPRHHVDDAQRIVNYITSGFLLVLHSAELGGVENHTVKCWHLALPSHGPILEMLERELSYVAAPAPITSVGQVAPKETSWPGRDIKGGVPGVIYY